MFVVPGGKLFGRKSRRGKGYTFPFALQAFTSSTTVTIPPNATCAHIVIFGAGHGGNTSMSTCPVAIPGSPGVTAEKMLTGLVPGETLTITIGAGGANTGNNAPGGTTSVTSGTCNANVSVSGSGVLTNCDVAYPNPAIMYQNVAAQSFAGLPGKIYIEWCP
jgi:hypothetical protein